MGVLTERGVRAAVNAMLVTCFLAGASVGFLIGMEYGRRTVEPQVVTVEAPSENPAPAPAPLRDNRPRVR